MNVTFGNGQTNEHIGGCRVSFATEKLQLCFRLLIRSKRSTNVLERFLLGVEKGLLRIYDNPVELIIEDLFENIAEKVIEEMFIIDPFNETEEK